VAFDAGDGVDNYGFRHNCLRESGWVGEWEGG
jgi:hypothetical protein